MTQYPPVEGRAPFKVPSIDEHCYTYYKIVGDLDSCGCPPVIIAHGGPGVGHEYLLPLTELWPKYGIPVIFYDQIGCASSTHLRHKAGDKSFWQEQLFQDELDNLIDHLDLRLRGFHLLGHSWGGMLASAFAARQPPGLQMVVLASALASKELAREGFRLQRDSFPPDLRQAAEEAEAKNEYEGAAYKSAMAYYQKTHVCRTQPIPPELGAAWKNLSEDNTVNRTMNGRSAVDLDASNAQWSVIDRLSNINVPTFVYYGEYDTSHHIAQVPFLQNIRDVQVKVFTESGHMCHVEGRGIREEVIKSVGDFLKYGIVN
ncbi:proline-specific peptidase [Xylariaceae sp. FL1019]|nr:proline-specific peptidase [Xylariaceae sp. FL1019]